MPHPYTWRAFLRDGTTVGEGETFRGEKILSPIKFSNEPLQHLCFYPLDDPEWTTPIAVYLKSGEKLIYYYEKEIAIIPGATPRTVAIVLGITKVIEDIQFFSKTYFLPKGHVVICNGTYEDIINEQKWEQELASVAKLIQR